LDATVGIALPESAQRRNGIVFLICTSFTYLIAPVTYVGVLHATILDTLEANDTTANLPEAVYLWVTPAPVLIAWLWPSPRYLLPMLAGTLLAKGVAGGLLAWLFVQAPESWWVAGLIVHAAVIGVTGGVQNMCLWELIGRGMSPELRGRMLGWTFGIGPLFAVLGSCATQLVLSGEFQGVLHMSALPRPWNYVVIFGATCPAMLLCAASAALARMPPAAEAPASSRAADVVQGLRAYFLNPLILTAACAFLLTYGGTMIMNNLSLYAREALGGTPEEYAGLQLALRFGFKCVAGFGLGWLVTRIHAKASLLTTTAICLAGVAWAMFVPGKAYLLSFGLLGAGELFYIYYLNYITGCSSPQRMRENTAYTNLITIAIGFLPLAFGIISDLHGLKASFVAAAGVLAAALLIVQFGLPKEPVRTSD
jgi:MFS family permease